VVWTIAKTYAVAKVFWEVTRTVLYGSNMVLNGCYGVSRWLLGVSVSY